MTQLKVKQIWASGVESHAVAPGASGNLLIATNNYDAVANPTGNDDESFGYRKGSYWVNTSAKTLWVCTDPTDTSAVWRKIGGDPGYYFAQSTSLVTETSTTYVVLTGATLAVAEGDYLVGFASSIKGSEAGQDISIAWGVSGGWISGTERRIDWDSGSHGDQIYQGCGRLDFMSAGPGGETFDVRWKTASGTVSADGFTFWAMRI